MLDVIERIVDLLTSNADRGDEEAKKATAEYALTTLHGEQLPASLNKNTIHKITDTNGDYTIEYSIPENNNRFTIILTAIPDKTKPQKYVSKDPSQNFVLIKTRSDLVSFMKSTK